MDYHSTVLYRVTLYEVCISNTKPNRVVKEWQYIHSSRVDNSIEPPLNSKPHYFTYTHPKKDDMRRNPITYHYTHESEPTTPLAQPSTTSSDKV